MTLGTTLFATLASRNFARIQTEIGGLQERISAATQDPRPSADPARALQLSAAREVQDALSRFSVNAGTAAERLAHLDVTLGDVASHVRDLKDIVLQMGNASLTDEGRAGLRIEAEALREAILAAANRKDGTGQGLFSGYATGAAFEKTATGVRFAGNAGQPVAQLSESLRVATSLGGNEVFMTVETEGGVRSLFDLADDLVAALSPPISKATTSRTSVGTASLSIEPVQGEATLRFTLTGPGGSAEIEQRLPGSVEEAINAAAATTGITATTAADGSLRLASLGTIELSGMSRSDGAREVLATLTDERGREGWVVDKRFGASPMTAAFDAAIGHMAEQRARAGSLAASVDSQMEAIKGRQTRMTQTVAGLEDLDVAAAVTRLQALLLTQEAAQQTYVKIASRSLFDYLR
ncbi:flagellar hook-associated protein FlgL [Cereibacter azotoformans]|uniref:flagellar hook-associated protein FlgL n=1 Tax=Cereibacter azotoformans TaxID=43057 RepID=UPI000C6EED23|nr:flagellar hook-associated protein FlgL [Cereibacter azotoformans]